MLPAMNLAQVARILAGFTLFFSLIQGIPLAMEFLKPPASTVIPAIDAKRGLMISIGAGFLTSLLFWTAGRGAKIQMFRKEGLVVVGAAWLVAGLLGAIPFSSSGAMPTVADALFESVSGLTTTGATVLGATGTPKIESLPDSLLLWRSLLQWLGGLGIILVFIVLLPAMGVTGKNLLSSEQVGVSSESLRPRMRQQARWLFGVYITLTTLATLIYWWITDDFFDSMCHAFTTLASGGFSNKNTSIGGYELLSMEIAVIAFMFLAGCNFTLLLTTARTGVAKPLAIFKNPEFRMYLGLIIVLVLGATFVLWEDGAANYQDFGDCVRDAAFTVVSIITSTGYATANFQNWPAAAILIILFCMFVGGCSGSTAGGFKVVRLLVVYKLMVYQLHHFIRPKSVEKIRVGHDVIPNSITAAILAMLILWIGSVAVGTLALSLDSRLHIFDCLAMSISMSGCTGPSITAVDGASMLVNSAGIDVGPCGNYGDLRPWSKILMCFQMVLGRLEFLVPLALVTPSFWKR